MDGMNILAVTNSRFLEPFLVMLDSFLLLHPNKTVRIFLAYEDLTQEEIGKVGALIKTFSGAGEKVTLVPIYVGDECKKRLPEKNGFPVEVCYRILALELLPEDVDRVLYLDADMVIKGNLEELYQADLKENLFVACEDITGIINGFHEQNKRRLGIPAELTYFNSGVMLFDVTKMRKTNMPRILIDALYEHTERYEYPDQDVLNEKCCSKVILADWEAYNCPPLVYYKKVNPSDGKPAEYATYEELRAGAGQADGFFDRYRDVTYEVFQRASIIHYLGKTKPWLKDREESKAYDIFDAAYQIFRENLEKRIVL